jgi:hypothetical protein
MKLEAAQGCITYNAATIEPPPKKHQQQAPWLQTIDLMDNHHLKAECSRNDQSTTKTRPAINMMIDTWVHMVQAGRLPSAWTTHRNKA